MYEPEEIGSDTTKFQYSLEWESLKTKWEWEA